MSIITDNNSIPVTVLVSISEYLADTRCSVENLIIHEKLLKESTNSRQIVERILMYNSRQMFKKNLNNSHQLLSTEHIIISCSSTKGILHQQFSFYLVILSTSTGSPPPYFRDMSVNHIIINKRDKKNLLF